MAALAPITMRITDGRPTKADAPVVKSRAFQLTTEEARAEQDVVTGMCLFFSTLYLFALLMCTLCLCIETFLVNGMMVHVLFDSGTTRSFLSLALNKKLREPWIPHSRWGLRMTVPCVLRGCIGNMSKMYSERGFVLI